MEKYDRGMTEKLKFQLQTQLTNFNKRSVHKQEKPQVWRKLAAFLAF